MRWRRRAKPARPSICCLIFLVPGPWSLVPGPWSLVLAPSVRPLWVREGECGAAACPLRSSIDAVGSAVLLRRRACQRANKLRARSDAEFAVSVGQVVLDRLRGKEQLRGRLGVGRAVPDNEGDLQLLSG